MKHDCILAGINKLQQEGQRLLIKTPSKSVSIAENDYLLMSCDGAAKHKIKKIFGVSKGSIPDKHISDAVQ